MKNRVTVTIAGQEYTLVGTEEASYTEKVAAHVDAKVEEVLSGAHVSLVDGAILAAVNIADEYFKEVEAAENLRRQLKEYLEEALREMEADPVIMDVLGGHVASHYIHGKMKEWNEYCIRVSNWELEKYLVTY